MENHRFDAPKAEVQDIVAAPVHVRRPLSVWLLMGVLALFVVLNVYGQLSFWATVRTQQLPFMPMMLLRTALQLGLVALVVAAILWAYRGWPGARWVCLLMIAIVAFQTYRTLEVIRLNIDAELDAGGIARYGLMPALFLGWAYAAAFSRKARVYFSKGRVAA